MIAPKFSEAEFAALNTTVLCQTYSLICSLSNSTDPLVDTVEKKLNLRHSRGLDHSTSLQFRHNSISLQFRHNATMK